MISPSKWDLGTGGIVYLKTDMTYDGKDPSSIVNLFKATLGNTCKKPCARWEVSPVRCSKI